MAYLVVPGEFEVKSVGKDDQPTLFPDSLVASRTRNTNLKKKKKTNFASYNSGCCLFANGLPD